jgi:crotonobetainyl-CoA:carnitine CoA-transferase CaiB-like acyl-CoA transferase
MDEEKIRPFDMIPRPHGFENVFAGLTVLELAGVLAGPAVGMFFAELGAHVVKIENGPAGGDLTRHWKLPSENPESTVSAYYASVNWGKEIRQMDLRQSEDQAAVHELARQADIVVTNFKEQAALRMRMDPSTLLALNPGLIVAELSGFGPDDDRVAFDVVLQAEAGFLYMTGEPGRPPVKMPVALIDLLAAHQLKEGLLVALLQRARTGKGGLLRVSLLASAVASLANQATNWLMGGHVPQPMGTLHPNIAPYGEMFRTADRRLVLLAVGTDKQFEGLCTVLNHRDWLLDDRFATNRERVIHRVDLARALEAAIEEISSDAFLGACHQHQVPAGLVRNMPEVFEQSLAAGMVLEDILEDGQTGRRVKTVAFEWKPV